MSNSKAYNRRYYKKHKLEIQERQRPIAKVHNWAKRGIAITLEEYNQMVKDQNGVCKICGGKGARDLCADHDHATGRVRGLLCSKCNYILGYCNDNTQVLRNAIAYLEG
jgi:hypothetical protein